MGLFDRNSFITRIVTYLHLATRRTNKLVLILFAIVFSSWFLVYSPDVISYQDLNIFNGNKVKDPSLKHPSRDVIKYLKENENITDYHTVFKKEFQIAHPEDSSKLHESTTLELLDFDRSNIKYIYPEVIDSLYNLTDKDAVDWSKYAYVLYATSSAHMCNSMMIFAELRKFNTRAELVLLVKEEFLTKPDEFQYEYTTLTQFASTYKVKLKATPVIQIGGDSVNIWLSSFTKLMVFNETEYDRIVYMDSDAILMKDNLDELFFLPPCKIAVSTAYWHTKGKFSKMSKEEITKKYNPEEFGFVPLTAKRRLHKIKSFIKANIWKYIMPSNRKLPTVIPQYPMNDIDGQLTPLELEKLKMKVNKKNFYTNVYNNLPNYPTLKEFDLTNIIMVIEPTAELFQKVLKAISEKKKDEYDMELVQYHLFEFFDILSRQEQLSDENMPIYPFEKRLEESPEFLILPHQVYGTLTPEINSEVYHNSYMTDAHEQIFAHLELPTASNSKAYYDLNEMENAADHFFPNVKYLHFSDAPIPKPWFLQKPSSSYMGFRTRCPTHPDFSKDESVVKPKPKTKDCSAGKKWENAHKMFKEIRKDVCGLDLIDTNEDTYYKVIN